MKINVKVVVNECCSWKWRLLCSISAVNSWGENNNRLTACACVCMCLCVRACVRASVCVWALSQIRASTSAAAVGARVHRSAANSGLFLFCLFFCWGFFFLSFFPLFGDCWRNFGAEQRGRSCSQNQPRAAHGHKLRRYKSAPDAEFEAVFADQVKGNTRRWRFKRSSEFLVSDFLSFRAGFRNPLHAEWAA